MRLLVLSFRTWRSRLTSWRRVCAFVFLMPVVLVMFYPWAGRTSVEHTAAVAGYVQGLLARLADPVLWQRSVISGICLLVLVGLLSFLTTRGFLYFGAIFFVCCAVLAYRQGAGVGLCLFFLAFSAFSAVVGRRC